MGRGFGFGSEKMGAIAGEELSKWEKMQGVMSGCEEKILVLLRLRPLSEKEVSGNESADWECINDTTILYRNTLREGSTFPSAYTFGKKMSILNLKLHSIDWNLDQNNSWILITRLISLKMGGFDQRINFI